MIDLGYCTTCMGGPIGPRSMCHVDDGIFIGMCVVYIKTVWGLWRRGRGNSIHHG